MSLTKLSDIEKAASPEPWIYRKESYEGRVYEELICLGYWTHDYGLSVPVAQDYVDATVSRKDARLIVSLRNLARPLIEVAKAANDVVIFTGPEWRDGEYQRLAEISLTSAVAALNAAIDKELGG